MKTSVSVATDFKLAYLLAMMLEDKPYIRESAGASAFPLLKGFDARVVALVREFATNAAFRVFTNAYVEKLSQSFKLKNSQVPKPSPLHDASRANCICLILNVLVDLLIVHPIKDVFFEDLFKSVDFALIC